MRPVMDSYDPGRFPAEPLPCPRCGETAPMRFSGPCPACLGHLREQIRGVAATIDAEYVPKVNVTANAVATRDD